MYYYLFFLKTATITHLFDTEILVFEARYDLFFGMLQSVFPILFIGFSEGRIFKKEIAFHIKNSVFQSSFKTVDSSEEKPTEV